MLTEWARVPKIGVANPTLSLEALVDADLDPSVAHECGRGGECIRGAHRAMVAVRRAAAPGKQQG